MPHPFAHTLAVVETHGIYILYIYRYISHVACWLSVADGILTLSSWGGGGGTRRIKPEVPASRCVTRPPMDELAAKNIFVLLGL